MQLLGPILATDGEALVFDGIPIGFIDGLGVVGVVVLVGLGLATGRLFTKRQYDEAVHDRDEWRAESRIKDQQIAEKDTQIRHMSEGFGLLGNVTSAIQSLASSGGSRKEGKP